MYVLCLESKDGATQMNEFIEAIDNLDTDYDMANYDVANCDMANYDMANYDMANYDMALPM